MKASVIALGLASWTILFAIVAFFLVESWAVPVLFLCSAVVLTFAGWIMAGDDPLDFYDEDDA